MAKMLGEAKKLGFGLMRLPLTDPNAPDSVDLPELCRMVDSFIAQGFTYFDTAWMYCGGKSESAAKAALVDRYPRDSFTLTDKLHVMMLPNHVSEDCERSFQEQLRRTGAGYFDYYWIHDVNAHTLQTFEELKCFDFVAEKKRQGLVKHIGFSFHADPALLDRVLTDHPEMEYVQLQLNYLDWESTGVQSRLCYEVAVKHGKPVVVMEPVKGGTLAKLPEEAQALLTAADSNRSVPSWAIRFAASRPNVIMVLSGMSNLAQLTDNTSYMSDFKPLTPAEDAMMAQIASILNRRIAIPCTGCAYCTVSCPRRIAIPQYFALYNNDMHGELPPRWSPQFTYYANLNKNFGKASDCVRCGKCEAMCPQHLPIRDYLKQVSEHFE